MKNLKKTLAILLTLVLVLSLAACGDSKKPVDNNGTDDNDSDSVDEDDNQPDLADSDTLVVGAAELNGDYISGFSNSLYDVWVKLLLGNYGQDLGYATYYYDENGNFQLNETVVKEEPTTKVNEDGSKTYEFAINDNLVWNDGTPITAKDYVFGILYNASPEWALTGANNGTAAEDLLGFNEYHEGKTRSFAGVELVDDYTFRITLAPEAIPYFHETALVSASPTPLHRYAPNLDVVGSELAVKEGYEINDDDRASLVSSQQDKIDAANEEFEADWQDVQDYFEDYGLDEDQIAQFKEVLDGDYKAYYEEVTADDYDGEEADSTLLSLIEEKLVVAEEQATLDGYEDGSIELNPLELLMTASTNDIAFNYRFNPDVTSGPYSFVEFGNNMVKVTLNDKFVGNFEGKVPTIKNVVVRTVQSKLDVDLVLSGDIDISPGAIEGDKINKAIENADKVSYSSYYRNGYGVMPIITDMGATQYKGVRQAIAFSLDRDEFVQTIAEGYGTTVNGAYGVDQWEYLDNQDAIEENLVHYTRNEDKANEALDTTPYIYEADGTTPWDAEKAIDEYNKDSENFNYWRYDSEGKQLRVIHEGTADLNVSELIQNQLPDQAKKVGLQYIFKPVDFATMLTHYYNPDKNDPDVPTVFNMGTSFATPNDPYYSYHSSQIGADNNSRVNDPEVDSILEKMRKADPSDKDTWSKGWYDYQVWYNDYMPAVPLYGNEYYDIYTNRVSGLDTTPFWDWSQVICNLSLSE